MKSLKVMLLGTLGFVTMLSVTGCTMEQDVSSNADESVETDQEAVQSGCALIPGDGIVSAGSQLIWSFYNDGNVNCTSASNSTYTEIVRCNRPQPGGQYFNCSVILRENFDVNVGKSKIWIKNKSSFSCSGPTPQIPNGQALRARAMYRKTPGGSIGTVYSNTDYNCQ